MSTDIWPEILAARDELIAYAEKYGRDFQMSDDACRTLMKEAQSQGVPPTELLQALREQAIKQILENHRVDPQPRPSLH